MADALRPRTAILRALPARRLARCISVGHEEPYRLLEHVEGTPAAKFLAGAPIDVAVLLMRQACEGLHDLHVHGLLHLAMDTANCIVEKSADEAGPPTLRVTGWTGIPIAVAARLKMERVVSRTADAQNGRDLGVRTDLQLLGATFYELLTGTNPLSRGQQGRRASELRADLPVELDLLLESMLEARPNARPASAAWLIEQLDRLLERLGSSGERPSPPAPALALLRTESPVNLTSQFAELETLWSLCADKGEPRIVHVRGSSGSGRTTFLAAARDRLRTLGATVLTSGGARGPLGSLSSIVEQGLALATEDERATLISTLAESSTGNASPTLPNEFVQLLRSIAKRRPVALLVDDAHSLPPAGARMLRTIENGIVLELLDRAPCGLLVVEARGHEDAGAADTESEEPLPHEREIVLGETSADDLRKLQTKLLGSNALSTEVGEALVAASDGLPGRLVLLLHAMQCKGWVRTTTNGLTIDAGVEEVRSLGGVEGAAACLAEAAGAEGRELLSRIPLHESISEEQLAASCGISSTDSAERCLALCRLGAIDLVSGEVDHWRLRSAFLQRAVTSTAGETSPTGSTTLEPSSPSTSGMVQETPGAASPELAAGGTTAVAEAPLGIAEIAELIRANKLSQAVTAAAAARRRAEAHLDLAQVLELGLLEATARVASVRELDAAVTLAHRSLQLAQCLRDSLGQARALTLLARAERELGRLGSAIQHAERAVEVSAGEVSAGETAADWAEIHRDALLALAETLLALGASSMAMDLGRSLIELHGEHDSLDVSETQCFLAELALATGQPMRAQTIVEDIRDGETPPPPNLADRLVRLELEAAIALEDEATAAALVDEIDDGLPMHQVRERATVEQLAARLQAKRDPREALARLGRALQLLRNLAASDLRARILGQMGELYVLAGSPHDAGPFYARSRSLLTAVAGSITDPEMRDAYLGVEWRKEVFSWLDAHPRALAEVSSRSSGRNPPLTASNDTFTRNTSDMLESLRRVTGASRASLFVLEADDTLQVLARVPFEPRLPVDEKAELPGAENIRLAVEECRPVRLEQRPPSYILPLSRLTVPPRNASLARATCEGIVLFEDLPRDRQGTESLQALQRLLSEMLLGDRVLRENATDELTGLWNRQAFLRELGRQVEGARTPSTVMLLGMIGLEKVRKAHGRWVVEAAVRSVAEMLCLGLRQEDLLGRFAEDEFVALLAAAGPDEAARVAERLQSSLRAYPLPRGVELSLAIGVAEVESLEDPAQAVDNAWSAMNAGREGDRGGGVIEFCAEMLAKQIGGNDVLAGIISGDPVRDQRNVRLLLDALAAANSDEPREEMLAEVVDLIVEFSGADRGILFLEDEDGDLQPEIIRYARARSRLMSGWSKSVPKAVYLTRQPIFLDNAIDSSLADSARSIVDLELNTLMCAPLEGRYQTIGVLYVDGRKERNQLIESDLTFFHVLTREVARALELAELRHTAREKELLDRDLKIAQAVHAHLMPLAWPVIKGLDVAGRTVPARELGGDYFDFFPASETNDGMIVIGDVSGKGVGAALLVSMAKSTLALLDKMGSFSPREKMVQLGRQIRSLTETGQFMSAVFATWQPTTRQLCWVSGGHEHVLVARREGGVESLRTGGILLGLGAATEGLIEESSAQLEQGDTVLLYTDGATDARDPEGNVFGLDALKASFLEVVDEEDSAESMLDGLLKTLNEFQGESSPTDDITLVVLRCVQ